MPGTMPESSVVPNSISPVRFQPAAWFLAVLSLVLTTKYFIIGRPEFSQRPVVSAGVTFDLIVGLPLLFYFVVLRGYRLPLSTLIAAFGGALALAYWLIPPAQQQYLGWAGYLASGLEVVAVGLALGRVRRIAQAYRAARQRGPDFLENLETALQAGLGRLAGPVLAEVALLRYALLGGWAAPEVGPTDTAFSSYRESGFGALVAVGGFVLVVESGALHLLLYRWNHVAAWLWLAVDVYTLLLLLAHAQAVRLRPVLVSATGVTVRVGLFWRVVAPRTALLSVGALTDAPAPRPGLLNAARPLLTPPNLLLTFVAPVVVDGPYGLRRSVTQLALYLDQPAAFRRLLMPAAAS